jgi:radical SAM protein (TIGR01212 family)
VDAGFTCPNVDGSITTGGCNFCDNRSFSPSRRIPRLPEILEQIDDGIRRLKRRYDCDQFIAYFQPATNTYGSVEKLRKLYETALSHPKVIGLAIGTRSDCVPNDVLDLLQEIASRTFLSVEYGLQTMHDRSLQWMNRGHDYASFVDAVQRSRNRGFEVCTHLIFGIPGESHEDMLATTRAVAQLPIQAVKIHNLYAVKKTALGEQVLKGEVELMGRDAYIQTVVDCLELLPPNMIVERISGDAPPDYFIGPSWCLDKPAVKIALEQEMLRRDTWQGKFYVPPST